MFDVVNTCKIIHEKANIEEKPIFLIKLLSKRVKFQTIGVLGYK